MDAGLEFNNKVIKHLFDSYNIKYRYFNKRYSPNAL